MDYDIIVIGAGAAGVCAAIQAGRAGAKCALIEKNGVPGGTMTACGIAAPGLFAVNGKKIIGGIGLELVEKTLEIEGKNLPDFTEWNPTFWKNQVDINPIIFAAVCDEELLSADVRIYYHTMLGNLRQVDNLWRATLCGKEGLFDLTAKIIIDCTGDANATSIAGFEVVVPENVQPGTYSVLLSSKINHDLKTELDFESMQKIFEEENMQDKIFSADVGWGESYATLFLDRKGINANHVCNINAYSSENRTKAEIEGRRSVLRAYKFYKKFPEFKDLTLRPYAFECGIRESRVIKGDYTISEDDYKNARKFEDALFFAWYPMDMHENTFINAQKIPLDILPTVPRSALLPKNSTNFAAAGRIISAERSAIAGLRVQAVCMACGQTAGAMAYLSIKNDQEMRDLSILEIKEFLQKYNAITP